MATLWSNLFNKPRAATNGRTTQIQHDNARFLLLLQQQRKRLKARLGSTLASTSILKVDNDKQLVYIDEFDLQTFNNRIQLPQAVQLSGQHNGLPIDFEAKLFFRGQAQGSPFYAFKLPQQRVYIQRRMAYRVPISSQLDIQLQLHTEQGQDYQGKVIDISSSGVQVRFEQDISDAAPLDQAFSALLSIEETQLPLSIQLRHIEKHPDDAAGPMRAGGFFANTSQAVERQLEHLIIRLQRYHAREQLA